MLKSLRKKPSNLDFNPQPQSDGSNTGSTPKVSDALHPSTAATQRPSTSRKSNERDHQRRPSSSLGHPSQSQALQTQEQPIQHPPRRQSLRARYRSDPLLSSTYQHHATSSSTQQISEDEDAAPAPQIGVTAPPRPSEQSKRTRSFLRPFQSLTRSRSSTPSDRLPDGDSEYRPSTSTLQSNQTHISFDQSVRPTYLTLPLSTGRKQSSESTDPPRASTSMFRFPVRRKKNDSLFPLPPKTSPLKSTTPMNRTPESSGINSEKSSPGDEIEDPSRASVSSERVSFNSSRNSAKTRMGSSGHHALPHNFTSPLARHNSTASTYSSNSGFAPPTVFSRDHRSRAGTMTSMPGRSEADRTHTPVTEDSGRNSTASTTLGRNSIAGLRSLTSRLKHPSEIGLSRRGSPGNGTPSHNASFAISQETLVLPQRLEGETAGRYYSRLEEEMPKKSIALVLSKSSEAFNHDVLRSLMRTFKFYEEPMDISLRKFLWEIDLPGEAQQIDRVMTAFAERYHECNPHIFDTSDEAYFVAYSLIILHSDLFNRNNKSKMQRHQYQKNTGGQGIPDEILGYFYDNIGYTEFVAQNPDDAESLSKPKSAAKKVRKVKARVAPDINDKTGKVDPYEVILSDKTKLDVLRPSLKDVLNLDDSFNYLGTSDTYDMVAIRRAFAHFGILQIISARSRPEAYTSQATTDDPTGAQPGVIDIRVVKVGIIWRKDDKKRKTRSKWQRWGAILTPSQLYFFRDISWIESLMTQATAHHRPHFQKYHRPVIFKPALEEFRCESHVAMADAVALQDANYKKHKHAFILARRGALAADRPQDRYFDEVLLAENESEMNDWLGKLNYAAAHNTSAIVTSLSFKSSSVTRPIEGQPAPKLTANRQQVEGQVEGDEVIESKIDESVTLTKIVSAPDNHSPGFLLSRRVTALEEGTSQAVKKLNENLKTARHLQILAPFPAKTRRELLGFGARMSHNVKWSRFDVWKLKCYRDLLVRDLQDGQIGMVAPPVAAAKQAEVKRSSSPSRTVDEVPLSELGSRTDHRTESRAESRVDETDRTEDAEASVVTDDGPSREPSLFGGIDEAFEPPNDIMERSASPGDGPFKLPPLTLSTRAPSTASVERSSEATRPINILEHKKSATSSRSTRPREASMSESGAETPAATPSSARGDLIRRGSLLPSSVERERPYGSPDSRKHSHRKSLQRTLRESKEMSASASTRGSRRIRDSVSSANPEESTHEGNGLTRKGGSFTIHGKKASVVTLGSEWANISAEERLRSRQQNQSDDTRSVSASRPVGSNLKTDGVTEDDSERPNVWHTRGKSSEPGFFVDAREEREHDVTYGNESEGSTDMEEDGIDEDTRSLTETSSAVSHEGNEA